MHRRPFRRTVIAVASAALAVLGTVGIADASYAATSYNTSANYTTGWTIRSTTLKKCARVTVSGVVKGTWRYLYNNGDLNDLQWTNLRLTNPTVSISSWGYTSSGCDSSKRWSMKADIQQAWYQTTCDVNVIRDVSFSIPWSISATLAPPSCGSSKAGNRRTTEGPSTGELNQFNSGTPIDFSSTQATVAARRGYPNGGLDFGGTFLIVLHSSSSSDTFKHSISVNINK